MPTYSYALAMACATVSLLSACASTPTDTAATEDASKLAQQACTDADDRPTTGTSISHQSCQRHSNVIVLRGENVLGAPRNTGGRSQAEGNN